MNKEVRELADAIRSGKYGPKGITVLTESSGHAKLYYDGTAIHERLESGEMGSPLTLPSTPSDARWYDNTVKTLLRSGVLDVDPRKTGQQGLTPEQEAEREAERERREARAQEREEETEEQREDARERQSNTTVLRGRAEKIFAPIGVWKPSGMGHSGWRGTIAEVARVSLAWAEREELPLLSENAAKDAWRRLYRDEPVNEDARGFLNAFIDYLDRADNAIRLYNEELRKLLGIGETRAPVPAAAPGPRAVADDEKEPVGSVREVVAAIEERNGIVTTQELREALPSLDPKTVAWAAWKAKDLGLIQGVARGQYARLEYDASSHEGDLDLGDESEAEEFVRVNVNEPEPEPEPEEEEMAIATVDLSPLVERLDELATEVRRLQDVRASSNGNGPPTLALECLAEMVGQHITVGGGEDGGITDEVLALIDQKRDRALTLAKRVAALETGTEAE